MVANNCQKCGRVVTDTEYKYSKQHYGKCICSSCQKGEKDLQAFEQADAKSEVLSDNSAKFGAGDHDVYIEVPLQTRLAGFLISLTSLVGLWRGFIKIPGDPEQTYMAYFFLTDWVSIAHITSQVGFFLVLIASFYLIFKVQAKPRVIWGS